MRTSIVGITGLYCAGKNYVADIFCKKGFAVLDVDKLGHIAIENEKAKIISIFGNDVLGCAGNVDRRALGRKVFCNPQKLDILEHIVHPEANRLTDEWIAAHANENCLINAALLYKSSALSKLDCIFFVRAPLFTRLARARARDHLSWREIIRRFASQKITLRKYTEYADTICICNAANGSQHLEAQIDAILGEF
ncbi:MAG: dephospho-CoA kinase [Termitinemataceae bacterium]|nr:MAG: dephospho-CoA kinase [Termitinemataceae bacterium]